MYVQEIKLKTIIERKVEYIKTSDIYMDKELVNVKKGELEAYDSILNDMNALSEICFVEKYTRIFCNKQKGFEQTYLEKLEQTEIEELTGYNNAIVFVLSLLDPQFEFND